MKRILHVLESLNRNGTETFIMNVFRKIDRTQFMFDFLIFKESKEGFEDELRNMGAEIYRLPHRKESLMKYSKALNEFFRINVGRYDIIHMHGLSYTTIAPLRYAKKYGIPKRIFHLHSNNCTGIHNKILHKINRLRLPSIATDLVACGKSAYEWGKPLRRKNIDVTIIPNGIELERFGFNGKTRLRYRWEMGISHDTFVIGNIASFIPAKNHSFLIDLMEKIVEKKENVKMVLIGDGQLWEEIREKVQRKGLKNNIILMGRVWLSEIYYSVFDVFVMPSLHEGFPFVVLEAQASRLPIVASDKISKETKLSNQFRFLSLEDSIDKWVDTILEFADHERYEYSYPFRLHNHSIENTVSKLIGIYS